MMILYALLYQLQMYDCEDYLIEDYYKNCQSFLLKMCTIINHRSPQLTMCFAFPRRFEIK